MSVLLNVCVELPLFHRIWSLAPQTDPLKESYWCTSVLTADDVTAPALSLSLNILPWTWDGNVLSCHHPQPSPETELNITINHVQLSTKCKTALQNATDVDPELSVLAQMIIVECQEFIEDVPHNLSKCQPSASVLTVEYGLILHEEACQYCHQNGMTHSGTNVKATNVTWRCCYIPRMWSTGQDKAKTLNISSLHVQHINASNHGRLTQFPNSNQFLIDHSRPCDLSFWAWSMNIPSHWHVLKDVVHVQAS